ncbi:MAG: carbohydrate binding domain-containing protein [Phycisphaeraceae bacterium]|nr:carbohydrate binding domain-containing protein [Phycisphaeraceae bacterium]
MSWTVRSRRRGSAYLLVLAVTVLVTATGIGTLLVQRIRTRTAVWSADGQRASAMAASAVEMAAYQLANRASWRTGFTSGSWTTAVSIGEGSLSFKLVDEVDGTLSDDSTEPVRVYGRAQVGSAVRVFSVVARPRAVTSDPNLLLNSGFEDKVNGWEAYGKATLELDASKVAGASSLRAKSRESATTGPSQDVTASVSKGTMTTSVWCYSDRSSAETLQVLLELETTGGTSTITLATGTVNRSWRQVSGTASVTWSGRLNRAVLRMRTVSDKADFLIDEVRFQPFGSSASTTTVMTFDPSTWRREADSAELIDDGKGAIVVVPR